MSGTSFGTTIERLTHANRSRPSRRPTTKVIGDVENGYASSMLSPRSLGDHHHSRRRVCFWTASDCNPERVAVTAATLRRRPPRDAGWLLHFQQLFDELSRGRRLPVARAHEPADQVALTVHEVHCGRTEHPIHAPRGVTAFVEQHPSRVAALLDRAPHQLRILTEGDHDELQALALQLAGHLV